MKKGLEIEHKMTEEHLQALFQGKKLVLDYAGFPKVTLYPPRYGVFMTHEKYAELESKIWARAFEECAEFLRNLKKEYNA